MLIELTIGNAWSFRERTTLSFMSTKSKELSKNISHVTVQGRKPKQISLCKSVAIYGANASGKSNIVDALTFFVTFVVSSLKKYEEGDKIPVVPYLLNVETVKAPSFFELVFICDSVQYRYGFEVDRKKIHNEWLFYSPRGYERRIFERKDNDIVFNNANKNAIDAKEMLRDNALYISIASRLNIEFAKKVTNFVGKLYLYDPVSMNNTRRLLGDLAKENIMHILLDALRIADIGISKISRREPTHDELMKAIKKRGFTDDQVDKILGDIKSGKAHAFALLFSHNMYDNDMKYVRHKDFDGEHESTGTIKYLALIALSIRSFINGGVVIVDELDTSLHSNLVIQFLKFFHSVCSDRAQLLFTSHNTNLFTTDVLRRDQIWLVDKDAFGQSALTPLTEYKVRKDARLDKMYLSGNFGGIPALHEGYQEKILEALSQLLDGEACKEEEETLLLEKRKAKKAVRKVEDA